MATAIHILNGPNLHALGRREPGIYGGASLADIEQDCTALAREFGVEIVFRQTNHEGELVDWLHAAGSSAAGVILNPAAYGHTSIALHDAVRAIAVPVIEVHLSNIHAREAFRHTSMVAPVARGVICGLGPAGYTLALRALVAAPHGQG